MKALMVDVDGVVVRTPLGGWAANLEADLGISTAALQAQFFKPHWPDVVLGKADLHERLAPVQPDGARRCGTAPSIYFRFWTEGARSGRRSIGDIAVGLRRL